MYDIVFESWETEHSSRVLAKVFLHINRLMIVGLYSLHFCMDTRSASAKIQDHVIINGSDMYTNETSISLTDRNSEIDISNL